MPPEKARVGEAGVGEFLRPLGRLTRVGPCGCGQLAKLANQVIVGITIGAVAEALLMAEQGGADPEAVRSALAGGFADSTVLKLHGERMIKKNFRPGAHAHVQLKDLRTANEFAHALGVELPMASLAERLFAEMCSNGRDSLDHSGLYLQIQERRGRG